jgi:sarcosine oxidase delta subunit
MTYRPGALFTYMNLHYKPVIVDKITNHNNTNHPNKPQYKYIRENPGRFAREIWNLIVNCEVNLNETVI